jgi:hypothetical protein
VAVEVEGLDVTLLRSEIQRTYASVSKEPDREFMFPTGRAWAQDLDYPADLLAGVPELSCESFAGVANPSCSAPSSPARTCWTSVAVPARTRSSPRRWWGAMDRSPEST